MNIKVLGIGNAFTPHLTGTSFLIKDFNAGYDLLIDCGFKVFEKLLTEKYDFSRLGYVAITHTHEGHICSLSSLFYYMKHQLNVDVPLLIKTTNKGSNGNADVLSCVLKYLEDITGHRYSETATLPETAIQSFKTTHTDLPSVGYIIPSAGIFTGDTKCCRSVLNAWLNYKLPVYHDILVGEYDNLLDIPHPVLDEMSLYYPDEMLSVDLIGVHHGDPDGHLYDSVIKLAKEESL